MAYTILIVDDSSTTRAMIKRTIRMADIPVSEMLDAADGQQALNVLASKKIDLVLADLNMPIMGGVEMTHAMRLNPLTRDIPVIVVSAEPNFNHLEELKRDGITGYVKKPFTPEAIRDVITQTLGVVHA